MPRLSPRCMGPGPSVPARGPRANGAKNVKARHISATWFVFPEINVERLRPGAYMLPKTTRPPHLEGCVLYNIIFCYIT